MSQRIRRNPFIKRLRALKGPANETLGREKSIQKGLPKSLQVRSAKPQGPFITYHWSSIIYQGRRERRGLPLARPAFQRFKVLPLVISHRLLVIFRLALCMLHGRSAQSFNHAFCKFRAFHFPDVRHLPGQVVGHQTIGNGFLDSLLYGQSCLRPPQVLQHHHPGQDQ